MKYEKTIKLPFKREFDFYLTTENEWNEYWLAFRFWFLTVLLFTPPGLCGGNHTGFALALGRIFVSCGLEKQQEKMSNEDFS